MNTRIFAAALMLTVLTLFGRAGAQQLGVGQADPNIVGDSALPLSSGTSLSNYYRPPSVAQQRAMFEAEQRTLRLEWNRWNGYSPLRPNMNASFVYGQAFYYYPQRSVLINTGHRGWYW